MAQSLVDGLEADDMDLIGKPAELIVEGTVALARGRTGSPLVRR